ncbi:MAG: cadmium-translocating P-type ATPase [Oscillospiraceae bacterium]|nr:cadmium-translocating P-type ATPase [Oscillospiraceae bacterium]
MKKRLIRIISCTAALAAGLALDTGDRRMSLLIFLLAYMIIGGDIVMRAAGNVLRGLIFDESLLMSIASIGAFIIGEYPEGVAVMLFFKIGELFQNSAVSKSRKSVAALTDIRPDRANLKIGDELVETDPRDVQPGDVIVIKAGERIPLDAKVIAGNSVIDTSALTGESVPRSVFPGVEILSGCVNIKGPLTAEVTKEYGESAASKILDLTENAVAKKAKTENFITKFAKYYTPVVVGLAALISVIPPLVIPGAGFSDWIYRGLTFLVISCPCALVVSVPLSFFGGIGGASRKGILVKGSNYLEALAKTEIVVFDKTGTLTKGVFEVREIRAVGMGKDELTELAAYAESYSDHPISVSLKKAYGKKIDTGRINDAEEIPGMGVRAVVDGKTVAAGNVKLMEKMNVSCADAGPAGTVVHVAAEGVYAGYILIADEIKKDARKAIADLKTAKIRKTVMLTGDAKDVGEMTAKEIGIDKVYAELLPGDKVAKTEELLLQRSAKGKLVYVGDGINDAPVLATADIGVAMGGLGSDAAIEASDVVIMTDEPSKISEAVKISRRTLGIVKQNIVFSLAVKFGVLILAAIGIASMGAGVAADVGVTLIAVLNATRALGRREPNKFLPN